MSGIYIDGISLGDNHWSIISKFFRAVVGPTDTTVEGRFVEEHGKIWLILNGERHEVTPVSDRGALMDRDDFFATCPELVDGYKRITDDLVVIPASEEAGE